MSPLPSCCEFHSKVECNQGNYCPVRQHKTLGEWQLVERTDDEQVERARWAKVFPMATGEGQRSRFVYDVVPAIDWVDHLLRAVAIVLLLAFLYLSASLAHNYFLNNWT